MTEDSNHTGNRLLGVADYLPMEKICKFYVKNRTQIDGTIDFFNPRLSYYKMGYFYKGREMDRFGYMSNNLTEWKRDNIFVHPLKFRAPIVLLITAFGFRFGKGITGKLITPAVFYVGAACVLAPEIVNPYYTTYMMNRRFPASSTETHYSDYARSAACWTFRNVKQVACCAKNVISEMMAPAPAVEAPQDETKAE